MEGWLSDVHTHLSPVLFVLRHSSRSFNSKSTSTPLHLPNDTKVNI